MAYQTIITAEELVENLENPLWAIMDCRFDLEDPEAGLRDFQAGHIPGAQYVNLDLDLASPVIPGETGRHPLPDIQEFSERLSAWGIDEDIQVVAYDNKGGGLAARLWWLLRWLGHERVAILDGGWPAWERSDYPIETEIKTREKRIFEASENPDMIADLNFVDEVRLDPDFLLVDARSAERYWGIKETVDSRAGHITGAISAPFEANLKEDGTFLDRASLKDRFAMMLDGLPAEQVVFYCGSGVTAAHNIVAMVAAGYDMPRLYPGSWSEWCLDPDRPSETS